MKLFRIVFYPISIILTAFVVHILRWRGVKLINTYTEQSYYCFVHESKYIAEDGTIHTLYICNNNVLRAVGVDTNTIAGMLPTGEVQFFYLSDDVMKKVPFDENYDKINSALKWEPITKNMHRYYWQGVFKIKK